MTTSPTTASASARIDDKTNNPESSATATYTNIPIVEEDWSQFMKTGADSGGNAYDCKDQSFSYYDMVFVPLSSGREQHFDRDSKPREGKQALQHPLIMEIRCMKSLTPMDMLNLSNGFSDATGNRIWMGAVFFLECMIREIDLRDSNQERESSSYNAQQNQRHALLDLRTKLFRNKKILELGSGTGAALIAVAMAGSRMGETLSPSGSTKKGFHPSVMILTDNDTNVLSLCQMNCDRNLRRHDKSIVDYRVGNLDWGDFYGQQSSGDNSQYSVTAEHKGPFFIDYNGLRGTLDTVVATDVIYDVAAIPLLMATAEGLLREGGFFVLAHVPRASIECEPSRIRDALEELIVSEATKVGFETNLYEHNTISSNAEEDTNSWEILFGGDEKRASILRPSTLAQAFTNRSEPQEENQILQNNKAVLSVSSDYDYEELESCGASIMIFVKKVNKNSSNCNR